MDPSGALTAALGADASLTSLTLQGNNFSEGEKQGSPRRDGRQGAEDLMGAP